MNSALNLLSLIQVDSLTHQYKHNCVRDICIVSTYKFFCRHDPGHCDPVMLRTVGTGQHDLCLVGMCQVNHYRYIQTLS